MTRWSRLLGPALLVLYGVAIWGPPRLRFDRRFDLESLEKVAAELSFEGGFAFDTANLIHLACWAALGLAVYLMFAYRASFFMKRLLAAPTRWYVLFGIWAVASATYAPSAGYTAFFASKILVFLLASLVIQRLHGEHAPFHVLFVVYAVQWSAIAILYIFRPELVGVYNPNSGYRLHGGILLDYGMSAAYVGMFLLTRALTSSHNQGWYWTFYGVSWLFIVLSQTRTTMLAALMVFGFVVFALARRTLKFNLLLVGILVLGASLLLGAGDAAIDYVVRGQSTEELKSLSDRAGAFSYLIDYWMKSPILGYGYASGTRELMAGFFNETGLAMGAAHDVLSKVLADLGLVGAAILTATLLSVLRALWVLWSLAQPHDERYVLLVWVSAFLIYIGVASVTGEGFAAGPPVFVMSLVTLQQMLRARSVDVRASTTSIGFHAEAVPARRREITRSVGDSS